MKNILGVLGLAYKAGALAAGTNNVLNTIKSEKAKLVILTEDISENTKKVLTDKASYRNIKTFTIPVTMDELARALGKTRTSSAAVTNESFLASLDKKLGIKPSKNKDNPELENFTEA